MNAILKLPPLELLAIWSELEQCLHGAHGFGGDTAEIYAYRLMKDNPILRAGAQNATLFLNVERAACSDAHDILSAILTLFSEQRGCRVTVNGIALRAWIKKREVDQLNNGRVHVRVTHRK